MAGHICTLIICSHLPCLFYQAIFSVAFQLFSSRRRVRLFMMDADEEEEEEDCEEGEEEEAEKSGLIEEANTSELTEDDENKENTLMDL